MKNYKEFVKHIRDEIDFIFKHTKQLNYENFFSDGILLRACVRSIEVIGEASKNIPNEVKSRHSDIEWKKIAGTRDILIHHYFEIDYEILWDIIKNKLPSLYEEVIKILNEE